MFYGVLPDVGTGKWFHPQNKAIALKNQARPYLRAFRVCWWCGGGWERLDLRSFQWRAGSELLLDHTLRV